ncbi:hypothetical protein [Actinoallomurus rhizosphaericola]|uniref:hypothetical protein n=1 Tax=Actinoallomurus rhizosphaericola TaxID=2952536 RepID=UPI0020922F8E|nr:hypothetical protein [Actinoallomurus rhizosphaericola]MCO5996676.1 hypothetical protein [Actinoallomurus rhizosphaericola]
MGEPPGGLLDGGQLTGHPPGGQRPHDVLGQADRPGHRRVRRRPQTVPKSIAI